MLGSRGVMKSCDGSLHSRLGMTRGRQVALLACAGLLSMDAVAAGDAATAKTFGILAVLIVLAKAASLVERFKQPAVLGEIAMGIIVGNLFLLGFDFFEPAKKDPILQFLAEFGVVVLLFQIGLSFALIVAIRRLGFPPNYQAVGPAIALMLLALSVRA